MSNWIFGLQHGFCRGGDIASMIESSIGFPIRPYECGVLHLAYYDLEFLGVDDIVRYVGCDDGSEAGSVLTVLQERGWMECDNDGDWSLTSNGYEIQEQINDIFEAIAHIIQDIETRRRSPRMTKRVEH